MEETNLSEQFNQVKNKYETLGLNLSQALGMFLTENEIKILSVNHRVKEESSFIEKIERKNYGNPFEEIEDICGIRIVCYYQSDVEKICELINQEFEVLENQDKEELLKADQFGYRSTHFIVKIKNSWLQAPNYRGLENLKAEIQIRTVLMHAWAEIEHKLAYKKAAHVPKQFKRKLSRISAKLEEADEQFEELKIEILNYKEDITESSKDEKIEGKEIELNLDSLQAFLDANFPDRKKDISQTTLLLDEFLKFNISLNKLISSYQKVKKYLPEYERENFENISINSISLKGRKWTQTGAARVVIDLIDREHTENRKAQIINATTLDKWRLKIEKELTNSKSDTI